MTIPVPEPHRPKRADCHSHHLVDLENLLGTERSAPAVRELWDRYVRWAPVRLGDAVTVATGPALAPTAWFVLPPRSVRRLVLGGLNGADRALLEAADVEHLRRRYDRLVIASGDRAFAELAANAVAVGLPVVVVLGVGRPAAALLAAATQIVRLPPPAPRARLAKAVGE